MLLEHHLKELKLPTFLREYGKVAGQCAAEGADHPGYLLRLSELELIDRHHRMVDRRIKAARFPATKSLDTFDFLAMPSVNKHLVMQLARCEYVDRRENVIAIGNSGTGKTHVALGLGLATAASLVRELIEARDERRLLNLQKKLARLKLLIVDELGFVPLSKTGAETPLRGLQPEIRERVGPGHHQPALRRVARGLRLGETHRRPAGPPHSQSSHPGDERRELPPQAEPAGRHHALSHRFPWRLDSTDLAATKGSRRHSSQADIFAEHRRSSGTLLLRPVV